MQRSSATIIAKVGQHIVFSLIESAYINGSAAIHLVICCCCRMMLVVRRPGRMARFALLG